MASAISTCGAATPDGEIVAERTGRRGLVSDPDIVTAFPSTFGAESKNAAEAATKNRRLQQTIDGDAHAHTVARSRSADRDDDRTTAEDEGTIARR